ncbi:hypothetical protein BofuT4_P094540.1 [Botrytis cinerea T4]|uniref:2EXR domain-containing protein n=1 Tax=Botryotinia fuckeliana (strain T4) TaxID=999810 RepID=G2YD98_BOTF4|nr:hypothetical protein BofuT4_P094540.1 [Botrytis cinerea T4]
MAITTLDRFTCFPELSPEIQMIIWAFCPYVEKQTIYIAEVWEVVQGVYPYADRSRTGDRLNPLAVDFPDAKFITVKYTVSSPLHICQQSRNVALQHYRRVATTYGDTKEGPAPFYINSYQDSIFFEDTIVVSPHFYRPTISFWGNDGKTLSTPDGKDLCTSVTTRWTRSYPPTTDHLMYMLSRFPEVKHFYFLDCPSGPFPVSSSWNSNIQWLSRNKIEQEVDLYMSFLSALAKHGTISQYAPDSTDLLECRGIFRSSWVLPLISCITTDEFNSLGNTEIE